MSHTFRGRLLASTLLVGAVIAGPAFAQATPPVAGSNAGPAGTVPQEAAPVAPNDTGAIVVTGSLIRNPNLTSVAPVATIGQNEISLRQATNAEQLVRDIPGTVPGLGTNVNNGTSGASTVNLRGLGDRRNLVLLDGARITPYSVDGVTDLDNIPLALVERTDVLTGGASTTYGADAISGVVNFITRSDFAGVDATVTEGISQRGDGNQLRADATIGGNFDDDKGNAVFSMGYQKVKPVYDGDRGYSNYAIDSFTGAVSGSGTTVPARFNGISVANPDGTRRQIIGETQINPTTGVLGAYNQPYNFNPSNVLQTPYERFNIYGAGHYNITDNIEFYTRGMFSKNTISSIIAPSGAFSVAADIPFSNPYLPVTTRNQICGAAGLSAAQCSAAAAATNPNDPNYRTFRTVLGRRAVEAGPRRSRYTTNYFDYRAGMRGDFNEHLHWDVVGSYGESDQSQQISGYTLTSRFQDALLATNRDTCLSGNAGCVPVNVFGPAGSITSDQLGYLTANSTQQIRTSLAQVHGQLTGELPINSPAANDPISFAAGGEYRYYTADRVSDELSRSGDLGGGSGPAPDIHGEYYTYEGFGELDAPIIQDKPFFDLFDVQAGIRRSQYVIKTTNTPTFGTTTWKAGANWQPIKDIKFRGNYQHAVRAPNIGELFTPVSTGLTNITVDPCAGAISAQLAAVCVAQGAPQGRIGSIGNPTGGQGNITTGGNPNLRPEKSNSYSFGAVLQPRFVPGLTVSVDYYHIKITDAITAATPGDLLNACFNAPSVTNPACLSIRRDPNTGQLDGDPNTTPGLAGALTNSGKILTDGIDVTANYSRNLGFGKLNVGFNGNWTNRSRFQSVSGALDRECVGYYSINCGPGYSLGQLQPRYSWNQRTTLTIKDLDLSLNWRHISSFKYEPQAIIDNKKTPYSGSLPGVTGLDGDYDFGRMKTKNYLDFAVRVGVNTNFDITMTVFNFLDTKAPLVGYNIGTTSANSGNVYPSTYDSIGRRFAVSGHVKF